MASCKADHAASSSINVVEIFDRGFASPERFCSSDLDTINELFFVYQICSPHNSKYLYHGIMGHDVVALTRTDVSEEATTCVFGFEL